MASEYSGADWLNRQGVDLSPLGVDVADLLGTLYKGIYHIHKEVRHKRTEWNNQNYIEIVVSGSMATYDDNLLTELVLLAHDRNVRVSIKGAAPGYMRLEFTRERRWS